jgi:hypothetical protein
MVLESATAGLQEEAQNRAAGRIDKDDDGDGAWDSMTPNSRGYRDGRDVVLPPISRVKLGIEIYTANSIESVNYAGFAVVIGMMFLSCFPKRCLEATQT